MYNKISLTGKAQQTILVVDDAPENIDVLTEILAPHYLTKVALNGEKALKIVAAQSVPPDLILLKPGKLDEAEWEIMHKHPVMGAEIIGQNCGELLKAASLVALTHHEKWDGSGYPNGLMGEAIPIFGRIVAIADVFDALTSLRPYKQPWSTFRSHPDPSFPVGIARYRTNQGEICGRTRCPYGYRTCTINR